MGLLTDKFMFPCLSVSPNAVVTSVAIQFTNFLGETGLQTVARWTYLASSGLLIHFQETRSVSGKLGTAISNMTTPGSDIIMLETSRVMLLV